MQTPRTNAERSEATSTALLDAARALFVEHGYGGTSTPAVCAAAGITRGALYHHFADKRDLFQAVLAREARAVADEIEAAAPAGLAPTQALLAGGDAYLASMAQPGRTRLLLTEGPAVLGRDAMQALDAAHAEASLRAGLQAVGVRGVDLALLTGWVSAAFDRAALDLQTGADPAAVRKAMRWLLARVCEDASAPVGSTRRTK
ncbi:helix-turn-helix domain-containing protein [Roseateles asaccharophilus]|uniref:AcrR family transcriptional regulator n=1 Tax=Roseateles asaccharophilus TaxID=582607 RepID=A0ABU2A4Y8_9BURK|nr:helix-turn-helix domain-containing protein [Roseateles asaccharophilus]MDR7332185.1 AcrR family transcriptional regulator [Roseateles asaccharophilus]